MKRPSIKRVWNLAIALVVLSAILRAGYQRNLQLSTDSGRSRLVHHLYGLTIWTEPSKATILSDWCQSEKQEKNWLEIGEKTSSLKTSSPSIPKYLAVLGHFKELESPVHISNDRKKYAEFLLSQLSNGESIGSVMNSCHEVMVDVQKLSQDQDFEKRPLSFEQLESLWQKLNSGD